jgi:hypothetical protein
VYFGESVSDDDWARCEAWRTFVVQRAVSSLEVEDVTWEGDRLERIRCIPCVGSYLADDRWAGLYVRLGERITTNRAHHVAALVPRAPRQSDRGASRE